MCIKFRSVQCQNSAAIHNSWIHHTTFLSKRLHTIETSACISDFISTPSKQGFSPSELPGFNLNIWLPQQHSDSSPNSSWFSFIGKERRWVMSRVDFSLGKIMRLLSNLFFVVSNRRSSTTSCNQSYSWDCASYLYCILSFWAAIGICKHCVSNLNIDDWEEYFQAQHMTYIEEDIPQKIGGILLGVIPVYASYKTSQTWWLFMDNILY